MSGFKDTTRTIKGHHHWNGGSIGGTGGTINRLAQGGSTGPVSNTGRRDGVPPFARGGPTDKIDGMGPKDLGGVKDFHPYGEDHGLLRRQTPMTEELKEAGGTSPLRSGFKKGGSAKHFHVHKHFHAKGGRTHTVSHSYGAMEKHAETYADGGHVHDSTHIPAGGPDYAKGGKAKVHIKPKNRGALHRDMGVPRGQKIPKSAIRSKLARDKASGNAKGVKRDVFALNFGHGKKPVHKNAGGALYAPGGMVAPRPMTGAPQPGGVLGRLAMRPQGLPVRGAPPMRRPMGLPGPQPLMRARGGPVGMRTVAKQEVAKHVRTAPPRGHGVR